MLRHLFLLPLGLAVCLPLSATMTAHLTPSTASPQLVGTTITWTASATDTNAGTLDFRFSVALGKGAYVILQDYDVSNQFVWTPYLNEGHYTVEVTARNLTTNQTTTVSVAYGITARVSTAPLISPTANPLVALYSAPVCPLGSSMYVSFNVTGFAATSTNTLPCTGIYTMNFYVAGMLPLTPYQMNYVLLTGSTTTLGPVKQFKTGAIPAGIVFPTMSVITPPNSGTASSQAVLLLDPFNNPTAAYVPTAVNFKGQVLWYYPGLASPAQYNAYFIRPLAGATMILYANDPNSTLIKNQLFREIDFAGNTIRQTSVTRINQQMAALGLLGITGFNHDALRLANGHTIVKATQEQLFAAGTQGSMGSSPVDILGDAVIDLDTNMQVAWTWSAFTYMNVNQPSPLHETCTPTSPDCPPMTLASVANDWTHMNSVFYIPSSGDLLVSLRNLDWVLKIDYNNGAGTGNVLWTLGAGGNFSFQSNDPQPWFSHQHDVEYQLGGTQVLSIYDNGNTRIAVNPGQHSRGQVLNINESALTVSFQLNADLGAFSYAVGSAQRLNNGNYHFESGWLGAEPATVAQAIEVLPSGALNFQLQNNSVSYRGYRMESLYQESAPTN